MSAELAMSDEVFGWLYPHAAMMDTRSFGGFVRLVGYVSRIGSAPTDEHDLATILGITVGYLRKRTWPLIRNFFVEDGDGRMTHPRVKQLALSPKGVAPHLSESRRAAGRVGGLKRAANQANRQANSQANPQANPSKSVANSTPVASDFASDLPGFATPLAPAPPSLSPSLLPSQPTDGKEESEEDGTGGEARASAGDGLANQANPQANSQAKSQANGQANPTQPAGRTPRYTLLADDWQPTAEAVAAMQALGHDPDHLAHKYRLLCRSTGRRARDHDAAFELFYLKEDRHDPGLRSAPRSISGGKATMAEPGWQDRTAGALERMAAAQAAREGRPPPPSRAQSPDPDDGPIIDAVAR